MQCEKLMLSWRGLFALHSAPHPFVFPGLLFPFLAICGTIETDSIQKFKYIRNNVYRTNL